MSGLSFNDVNGAETQSNLRFTLRKCAIRRAYDREYAEEKIQIWKKKFGKIEIKWSGRVPVKCVEMERCDKGHKHIVERTESWVWNYATLSAAEAKALAEFLLGRE